MTGPHFRQAHAVLDAESRTAKTKKIERVLAEVLPLAGTRLLDFGSGSGHVAKHLGNPLQASCDVDAVDVLDHRVEKDFHRFTKIEPGYPIPWSDAAFQAIVSNHVLEHVGGWDSRIAYLREIGRLLASGGFCYLALPNRWMLVEPHYRLPFLSWLPEGLRSICLRMLGKGRYYDCRPLSAFELENMLSETGLEYENICFRVLAISAEMERTFTAASRIASFIPCWLRKLLVPAIPTLCYLIRKRGAS